MFLGAPGENVLVQSTLRFVGQLFVSEHSTCSVPETAAMSVIDECMEGALCRRRKVIVGGRFLTSLILGLPIRLTRC